MNHRQKPTAVLSLRLKLPLVWLAILLILAIFLPGRVWNTLLVGLGGLFLISFVWAKLLQKSLRGRRELRFGWISVGDRLSEQFEIHNRALLPALWVEMRDFSNVPDYNPAIVRSVPQEGVDRWKQDAICQQRGQFHLGPWQLRTGDPFGIFVVTFQYPQQEEVIIHPPIHGRLPIELPAGQSDGRSRSRQRHWQAAVNTASVRDYRAGDPLRWIHWPTSARRDSLYVREFDLDAGGDIWLVLDLQADVQIGEGRSGTEEHAVVLAASLAAQGLQESRAVGLAAYGKTPQLIPPGRGEGQQWKLLRALALVNADGEADLAVALHDLGNIAQRGATAVVITANFSPDWLAGLVSTAQQGIQSSVVLLDRPSFGDKGNSQALRDTIRQLGFNAQIIYQNEIGQPLQEPEKQGYWEFRITPSGKAIPIKTPSSR